MNNDRVSQNQNNQNTFVNNPSGAGGNRNNFHIETNSNRDSGFDTMTRTNHERSDSAPQPSINSRPNNLVIQNNPNTSMLPLPNRSNTTSSNSTNAFGNNRTSFGSSNPQDADIVCNCNQEAKMFTVRKEGPNTGNIFFIQFNDF